MPNSSRTACSLAPAYFHHWRSKARISRSRRVSPSSVSSPRSSAGCGTSAASITVLARSHASGRSGESQLCDSGTFNHGSGGTTPLILPARPTRVPIMTVRPILVVGDPVLHTATRPVTTFDGELQSLVQDMFDTMGAADGVGLAANQVGVDLRLFVYDCPDDYGLPFRGVMANPVLETSGRPQSMPDPDDDWGGCLSVPGE